MVTQVTKPVILPAIADLDSLDTLRDSLLDAIETGPVRIVADTVERVSTNVLLLLLSAAESARRNHFELTIERPSPVLQSAIERLGLDGQFAGLIRE